VVDLWLILVRWSELYEQIVCVGYANMYIPIDAIFVVLHCKNTSLRWLAMPVSNLS
jgi:hypothetical protein